MIRKFQLLRDPSCKLFSPNVFLIFESFWAYMKDAKIMKRMPMESLLFLPLSVPYISWVHLSRRNQQGCISLNATPDLAWAALVFLQMSFFWARISSISHSLLFKNILSKFKHMMRSRQEKANNIVQMKWMLKESFSHKPICSLKLSTWQEVWCPSCQTWFQPATDISLQHGITVSLVSGNFYWTHTSNS